MSASFSSIFANSLPLTSPIQDTPFTHHDPHTLIIRDRADHFRFNELTVFGFVLSVLGVTLPEPLNAPRRIDQLLLARKEGMAMRADRDRDVLCGREGFNHMAAGTCDLDRM